MATDRGASPFNWSGFYAGAQVGQSWTTADHASRWLTGDVYSTSNELNRVIGGAYAGMNMQTERRLVFGVEGGVRFGDVSDRGGEYYENGIPTGVPAGYAHAEWSVGARARIGYAVNRFLPYIAVGFAVERVRVGYEVSWASNYGRDTMIGLSLGGGLEYALTGNVIARLDYRYADFGGRTLLVGGNWTTLANIDLDRHDLMFGLAYKF